MGIKGLFPFISDAAPLAIKETKLEAMTGLTIAIDASMCLYQFLVAVRQGEAQSNLSNASGEVTSHIQGFLSRTLKMLEAGIKPVYVFDGKPPELKLQTLAGRKEKKDEADSELAKAKVDAAEIDSKE
jgi:flap endonuclease-1